MRKISLRAARINAGLTLQDVADLLHKSKQTIINWELGRNKIDGGSFQFLCERYGFSTDDIFLPFEFTESKQSEP